MFDAENVSFCTPVSAAWAVVYLRQEFPHFCAGNIAKKIFLKASAVAEQKLRCPLVNNVSRQQIERGVDVAQTFAVEKPILSLSSGALSLVEKPPEVLARRLTIPRLVSAADDDVQAGPTLLAKIVAPPREDRVQLFELNAHGQLRSLERV
jgi:hypothetical protein